MRARLGTAAHFCKVAVLKSASLYLCPANENARRVYLKVRCAGRSTGWIASLDDGPQFPLQHATKVCVCVCVSVCEREKHRERARERATERERESER